MTIRQLISYVGLAIFCVPVFLFVFPPKHGDFTEIATDMSSNEQDATNKQLKRLNSLRKMDDVRKAAEKRATIKETASSMLLRLLGSDERQQAGEAAALALPKIFKNKTPFKNIKSSYDASRHALVVTAEVSYPGFSKIPDWKINQNLAQAKQSYCSHFINSKMRHTGLALELNLRTLEDDLTIGTILLSNTECSV